MSESKTIPDEELAIIKKIEKLNIDYNNSLNELSDTEMKAEETDSSIFKAFLNNDDSSKNEILMTFIENKLACLQKTKVSFRILQKLQQDHAAYQSAVINALRAKINSLENPTSESSSKGKERA